MGHAFNFGLNDRTRDAFTLIEMLVVISIIFVLMAIMLPAVAAVRRQARAVLCIANQRQIVAAVGTYAVDHQESYPDSAATITFGSEWHWQEPTMMTACKNRPGRPHRSAAEYLRYYLPDASVLFCPSAPGKYEFLRQAWHAGDSWDNPETSFGSDPVFGTYCFYWNYVGYLSDEGPPFVGPRTSLGGRRNSTLLVTDYFGYDHHRSPGAFGSCEKMRHADVTPGTEVSSPYWSRPGADGNPSEKPPAVRLHAGYTDGHVACFDPADALPMKVSIVPDGSVPYPSGVGLGPGDFYLPSDALP